MFKNHYLLAGIRELLAQRFIHDLIRISGRHVGGYVKYLRIRRNLVALMCSRERYLTTQCSAVESYLKLTYLKVRRRIRFPYVAQPTVVRYTKRGGPVHYIIMI